MLILTRSRLKRRRIRRRNKLGIAAVVCFFVVAALTLDAAARDIDLDEIYIKKSSPHMARLAVGKLDVCESAGAIFVDRDVAFAGWVSGAELFYIREFSPPDVNIMYLYNARIRVRRELHRIPGVITAAKTACGGRFAAMKRFISKNGRLPVGETLIYRIGSNDVRVFPRVTAFLDFDIPMEGNSIIHETSRGLEEFTVDGGYSTVRIKKDMYTDIAQANAPVVAYYSPDRRSTLLVSGGGGSYSAKVLGRSGSFRVGGITSAGEICWLDDRTFAYRSGSTGNFSVSIYTIGANSATTLMRNSMHTGISYAPQSRQLAFLKDGIICTYSHPGGKTVMTGIEGDDVNFSPSGVVFSMILYKKLFVVSPAAARKNRIDMQRKWDVVLQAYRELRNDGKSWENDYSLDYINRKINVYSGLMR